MKKKSGLIGLTIVVLIAVAVAWWLNMRPRPLMDANIDSSNGAHYTIKLPSDLKPATFNPAASLEYASEERELYAMIIDESKEKISSFGLDYDLDTYMKIALRSVDSTGMHMLNKMNIGTDKGLQAEVKSRYKGKEVVYKLTCIETPRYFYQILVWTLDSKFEKNKSDMDAMIQSFKERN
ncbi:MAG: hypothetical protein ACRCYO_06435 [Bacteroidia bacterium]